MAAPAVYNSIWIGYRWQQTFTLPAGAVRDGGHLRIQLRHASAPDAVPLDLTLARLNATDHELTLTADQTSGFARGSVMGDLVAVENGIERPIGTRITIPVLKSLTEPTP